MRRALPSLCLSLFLAPPLDAADAFAAFPAATQRQAILRMLDAPERPEWRHPAYWAPFVLVGRSE